MLTRPGWRVQKIAINANKTFPHVLFKIIFNANVVRKVFNLSDEELMSVHMKKNAIFILFLFASL